MDKSPTIAVDPSTCLGRLERMAFDHGQAYDSYLSTEGNLAQFWSSDQKCVIAYAKVGRFVHVQGGLLGPLENRPTLLREFAGFLQTHRYLATFYNIGEGDLPLFRDHGFQITKWGEEPLLDLASVTWSGHEYEWVRRQTNYCRRQDAVVTECVKDDYSESEWDELMDEIRSIKAECLSTKPQRGDVRFFNGEVNPPSWDRRRLFVARSDKGAGRIEGFLICLPYDGGRQWSIETYRHRLNAPRGIVAYLIHQTVETMKSEEIDSISLCLCPAVRYERLPNDSWIIRRCLQFGFHYASAFFDMPGEYHFKSRFRPRFIRRYICHWPRATAASMLSIVRLSGAVELDLTKFVCNLWHRFVRPKTRRNLARPAEKSSRTSVAAVPPKREESAAEMSVR